MFICRILGKDSNSQFSYAFEELDNRNIFSTNKLERLNRAIRRWSSIVGIFQTTGSYVKLITSLLEYSEDW
ncbi:MAG: transposase [Treponema sp.]